MSIAEERYVSLTTYRKNGTAKSTPIWIVDFGDGAVGCTTSSSSFKVTRIGNDPRVTLQPSNAKGDVRPGSEELTGTAEVVMGAEFERGMALVKKKYKLQATAIMVVGKVAKLVGKGSGTDCAVKITLT